MWLGHIKFPSLTVHELGSAGAFAPFLVVLSKDEVGFAPGLLWQLCFAHCLSKLQSVSMWFMRL